MRRRTGEALLLIDWINPLDFPGGRAFARPALQAARRTAELRRRRTAQGTPVIYANDNFGDWNSDLQQVVSEATGPRSNGRHIAALLQPAPGDLVVLKPRHSAFYQTPLDALLEKLHARRLILTGVAGDICVLFTANDAYLREYEIWVPADCIACETPAVKRAALGYMQRVLKADIRPSVRARPAARRRPPARSRTHGGR